MPRIAVVLSLVALLAASAYAGEAPSIEKVLIASGEGHFPVVLRLQDGRIAVVVRGGGPHLSIRGRIDIVFSSDEAKTWTKPTVVASETGADDRNPAFGQAADGTLVVVFYRLTRYDENGTYNPKLKTPVSMWVTRSKDGSEWSKPAQIDTSDIGWASPFGKMTTLPNGDMLMSAYGGADKSAKGSPGEGGFSYLYRSTDQGKTWSRYSTISPPGYDETAVIVLPSGRYLAGLRNNGKNPSVWLSESDDAGRTWSAPKKITPPGIYTADFLSLPDGRVLLTASNRTDTKGVSAIVSDGDANFDWKNNFTVADDNTNWDCGYPSSVLLKEGRILTTYYEAAAKSGPAIQCDGAIFKAPLARK